MKNGKATSQNSQNVLKSFLLASRPKTWIASLSPVCIGTALAPKLSLAIFIPNLLFSLFIQIGTNFANDYFDFINGADTHLRCGPKRATLEGWISPKSMLKATLFSFGSALIVAIPLMMLAGLWSFFLAALCISFGFLYTAGPKPLGYLGLGELLVFPFFGPIATAGSYFLQTGTLTLPVFIASLAPGFLSCSILIANNLRDENSDRAAKKLTLIARFGTTFGRLEYLLSIVFASLVPFILVFGFGKKWLLLIPSIILLIAIPTIKKVFTFRNPLELIPVLQQSSFLLLFYTTLFCLLW